MRELWRQIDISQKLNGRMYCVALHSFPLSLRDMGFGRSVILSSLGTFWPSMLASYRWAAGSDCMSCVLLRNLCHFPG